MRNELFRRLLIDVPRNSPGFSTCEFTSLPPVTSVPSPVFNHEKICLMLMHFGRTGAFAMRHHRVVTFVCLQLLGFKGGMRAASLSLNGGQICGRVVIHYRVRLPANNAAARRGRIDFFISGKRATWWAL